MNYQFYSRAKFGYKLTRVLRLTLLAATVAATAQFTAAVYAMESKDLTQIDSVGASIAAPDNAADEWQPPVAVKVILPPLVDAQTARELEEKWGVTLLSLRRAAEGYMLDFRFRVHDVNKALPLFESTIKPMLTVARSNAKLPVPAAAKIGSFRTTNRGKNIQADRNYFIMFANPDRHVKPGDEVSLAIGDFQVEALKVR